MKKINESGLSKEEKAKMKTIILSYADFKANIEEDSEVDDDLLRVYIDAARKCLPHFGVFAR